MAERSSIVEKALSQSDLFLAFGVVGVLLIMIIPLPTPLLDLLLSLNITLGIIILLVSMYIQQPLEFSAFPSVLLVTTLFRLSLNIASTRIILLRGNEGVDAAGQVIQAFGSFVVGGNYVVGLVVFLILVLINFVVITKGATRIAEVAARFTLDAMPGKQMSIDADLNAGLIDEAEARSRRLRISREADFYGSMDGASKFVRGDAIAGIIITVINIVGGLLIGILQQGMSMSDAAKTYTLLTIGDGLVSQVPALIISTAAGINVSRAASDANLGQDLARQLFLNPRAVGVAASIVFFFALIPGLPQIPFLVLSCIMGGMAYLGYRESKKGEKAEVEGVKQLPEEGVPEQVESLLPLDIMELEVGYGLIPLVDVQQDGSLLEKIKSIRRQFALEMGFIVPPLHIRDNLQLGPNEYSLLIKGNQITRGELEPDQLLAMKAGEISEEIEGIKTKEPAFGLPAKWIRPSEKERAQMAGYTVVEPATVLATHLTEVIRKHAHELMGRQETQKLLDNLAETHPKVVEELVPNILSVGQVQKVLQNLLRENVSIRDLLTILETLADYGHSISNTDVLTEYVRQGLARTITKQYQLEDRSLPLMTLDKTIEDIIVSSIHRTEQETYLSLDPSIAQKIITEFSRSNETFGRMNVQPVVLCSPVVRPHLKRLTERFFPNLAILSHNEIAPEAKIQSLGAVKV
ncbi:MAG: flagellar biosynthesis protein FlhA [Deltaproteobacteria bacterium]|nr:flagellar biosynthesis protein FlhA [Deltaproteobacteria bacterium]